MNSIKFICLSSILFFLSQIGLASEIENPTNRIEVLVNDKIITNYDIIQRIKISAIIRGINITDQNFNTITNSVTDELIDEKLKIEKVREYEIDITTDEYKNHEKRFLENFNYSKSEMQKIFLSNNVSYKSFKSYLEIDLKWQKLIYGLYLRVTSVTDTEINSLLASDASLSREMAKDIVLQKQLDINSNKLINDLRDEATIEFKQ